jgi:hypothetical protein
MGVFSEFPSHVWSQTFDGAGVGESVGFLVGESVGFLVGESVGLAVAAMVSKLRTRWRFGRPMVLKMI